MNKNGDTDPKPNSEHPAAAAALEGIRVLDFTRLLPGPFATRWLADFGAEVIKIEDTHTGDLTRFAPPYLGEGTHSAWFEALNRNKRSVAIDLKSEAGRGLVLALVDRADVLIEGFRPGVMERLGLGYGALAARNPRLIYCSLTGYGQDGPWAKRAGHDINYMAAAGALSLIGTEQSGPVVPNVQVADLTGALYAALGILAALQARARTGRGQSVDVAMHESVLSLLPLQTAEAFAGTLPRRGCGPLAGRHPNYTVYRTADRRSIAIGALEPKFWKAFCEAIERPDLEPLAGAAFSANADNADDTQARTTREELEHLFASKPLSYWQERFEAVDACVSPVLEVEEALASEQVHARGFILNTPHPALGSIEHVGAVPKLTHTPAHVRRSAPAHGADTEEVLRELGFTPTQIEELRHTGAIA